jgi:pimeloyl-ACP methyl ester carboxylesterase
MEPVEIEMTMYAAIAYPDICHIWKYTTPVQYERYKFGNLDIWRHSKNSRTAVITLSGGCRLEFCQYIQKLVDGLDLDADIYGIENFANYNFCCVGDIADFIRSIDYDTLIVMGFSMGGILGSQVLAQLNGDCGNTTMVVIGTPFNINNSTELFDNHMKLYRVDFSHLYYKAFRNSLNHNRGTLLSDMLTLGNYDGYARFIERIYTLPNFRFLMKINPNIPNCRVISFYNNREIVSNRERNIPDVEQFKSELDASSTFEEYAFDTWVPGHSSEWAQEANLQIIVKQIRSVLDKKI